MAQIKRKKVSKAATKGQGTGGIKGLIKNKKFWILVSVLAVAVATVIILVNVLSSKSSESSERKVQDYFGGEATNLSYHCDDTDKDVSFTKMSYAGVKLHNSDNNGDVNDTYVDYIFVFACDLNRFYADKAIDQDIDEDDTKYYSKEANELFNLLVKLQGNIDKYNEDHKDEEGSRVALYIVDTSINDNVPVYADTKLGGSDDFNGNAMFTLVHADKPIKEYYNLDGKKKTIYSDTEYSVISSTSINAALIFMNEQNFISNE